MALDRFERGDVEFLLLAPETLVDPEVLERLAAGCPSRTDAVVGRLEDLGALVVDAEGSVREPADDHEPGDIAIAAVAQQERRRAVEQSRVDMIRGYAESPGCRRAFLLGYFGEPFQPPCGRCDRCRALAAGDARPEPAPRFAEDAPFTINDRVRHVTFGGGTVTGMEPDRITVVFDGVGYRVIARSVIDRGGVLVPEG